MTPWNAHAWVIEAHSASAALNDGSSSLAVRFLSPSMARVTLRPAAGFKEPKTWAIAPFEGQDVSWEGRERSDASGFEAVETIHWQRGSASVFASSKLGVTLSTGPLRLEWHTGATPSNAGTPLASDRATSAYLRDGRTGAVRHYLTREVQEYFYGLGDKTGPLNLHGRRLRTAAMDSLGYDPEHGDPLYKHWPFVLSRTSNGQWMGLYYDTLATCTFDLGCEHDNYHEFYRYVDIDDGDLDYYLMQGATPGEVIAQFLQLIGGTHLPPRWALGFAQTAMGLADAPNAQDLLSQFIDSTQEHKVPVSAFHYGSGYSSRGKRRYVFTWNHDKFPNPKVLNAKFQQNGIGLVANIKPCLLDDHPAFAQVAGQGGFVQDDKGQPVLEPFWDGQGAHLDFTNPAAIAWWQNGLKAQVLDYGIGVGWNDNNEYAIQNEKALSHGFGQSIPMHRARPLHALLMTRATFEAQQQVAQPGQSVFTVTRAGSPGLQRYAQTWSGDNTTSWRTLKWNIRTGLQMSLSGMFNVGHDVGGFYGPLPEPELFLRWVQACALNPRMVMNSWKAGNVSNLPWMYPEVLGEIRRAINLRYQLMPYLWSLFERASAHHEPIIRPTFFDFPDDTQCYQDCDDFMLGPNLLVAPVIAQGSLQRTVYLPALPQAQAWFDFETRARFASGQWHTVDAPWSKLPLFVREGACISCASPAEGQVARFDDAVTDLKQF